MADSGFSESAITAEAGPLQSTITAHAGGVAVAPQFHACHIEGPVNISVSTFPGPALNSVETGTIQQPLIRATATSTDSWIKPVSEKLKSNLRKTFGSILEGIAKKGTPTLLNKFYTDLYLIEGEREGINHEHEVWDIDRVFKPQTSQDIPINLNDIFKALPGESEDFRVVLTKGIAGIGKTVSVHKFILDWAEDKANQDVDLMIVLPFRDLNTMIKDDESYSLQELLEEFCPELRDVKDPKAYENYNIVFIFDGLDESQLPLDFYKNKRVSNVTKKCSVDVLITNLILAKRLLPSARIWITSRPAAIHRVSNWTSHRLTEVQGFNDPQKEEYFRKKILDPVLARRVISHIKASRSLYIMCHIPVFCWISATVLSIPEVLDTTPENTPTSLTAMYTRFLLYQTQRKNVKYYGQHITMPLSEADMSIILKLGELAFANLEKQNLVFSENDLREHDIDITDVSVHSGVFTEVVKEEDPVIREKWYSFVHLTIQEYLAAFYVFYSFASKGSNPFPVKSIPRRLRYEYDYEDDYRYEDEYSSEHEHEAASQQMETLHDLHKAAIDKGLKSSNGHLDLFLRFLLGLSMDESLWRHFQLATTRDKESIKGTIQFIKAKLKEENERKLPSPERCFNLFHCLAELKDNSLVKEIQCLMTSRNLSSQKISAAQCTALAYMMTTSDEVIEEFDLKKYNTSREGRTRLIPVVGHCIRAKLADCTLTKKCCKTVAQALQASDSHLRELDLSHNCLWEPYLIALADGLKSPHCTLVSLDLSFVNLDKTGPTLLDGILLGPHNQPHTLRLSGCGLKQDACDVLAKALEIPTAQLKKLDISYNYLTDAGIQKVLQALLSNKCDLETLRLCACDITQKSCATLARVLRQSSLRELDLSGNNVGDEGVKLICTGLMSPHCQLQTLRLKDCNLSKRSCVALAPVLWSFSELKDLDLSDNDLLNTGVRLLSAGLRNPNCSLRVLRVSGCQITERGCALLASALIQNPTHLEELDLSYNHPGELGEQLLSARLKDQHCHLQKLNMEPAREQYLKSGLKKYAVHLTFDSSVGVVLSKDQKKATREMEMWDSPLYLSDSDDDVVETNRKNSKVQVACVQHLSEGRFYWEVDWTGMVSIGVRKKGALLFLQPEHFFLMCSKDQCVATHSGQASTKWISHLKKPNPNPQRIGVYLDWPAGTLSFYSVSPREKIFLHMFHTTFNTPVIPFFTFAEPHPYDGIGSVTLRTC